ncbi:ion transporter [Spirochaetota bacterium]
MKKLKSFLENFIMAAIILVIVQTFLDEYSRVAHWSVEVRNILIFCGLFFDFLFSVEFIVRTIASSREKRTLKYWFYERGWVDFLSSFPLLILDSGPSVYLLLSASSAESAAGIGVLNVLKVVKAVRVTRILRLVRIIKIFGKIHNAESKMAQHHTSSIATTAVFTIVCTLIALSFFTDGAGHKKIDERKAYYMGMVKSVEDISNRKGLYPEKIIVDLLDKDKKIIKCIYKKKVILRNKKDDEIKKYYTSDDYVVIKFKGLSLYVSLADIYSDLAIDHIKSFMIIVLTVLSFMIIYTRHFVQTISDMVHVLNKGFRKKDYNLQVKIREEYSDQEIFRLARFYNDAFLPAKLRSIQDKEDSKSSGLSMDDITDFK